MPKHAILIFLLLANLMLVTLVLAVTPGMAVLTTSASDKQTYNATFALGLSVNGGSTWQTTANVDQSILIKGSFDPVAAHVGSMADIFVVYYFNGQFFMQTVDGIWLPWAGSISSLQPAKENVLLAATQEVTILDGTIATSGQYRFYLGYLPTTSSVLIYGVAAPFFTISVPAADPQTYFEEEIFTNIVMPICSACHYEGNVNNASDLHFIRDANLAEENYDIFTTFYNQQPDAYNYVLTKVTGGNAHGGGTPLPIGFPNYEKMVAFLDLLEGNTTLPTPATLDLFQGVADQSSADTLHDAALLFAGRLPTSAETAAVASGGAIGFKTVLRDLMQGEHFHQFLKDAANDRLLIRGNEDFSLADDCPTCFPLLNAEFWRLQDIATASNLLADKNAVNLFMQKMTFSVLEEPLELIAYVVENDKPYAEILTADYTMLTPGWNAMVGGTAVFAAGADPFAFQPGRIQTYNLRDSATVLQQVSGAPLPRITYPGNTVVSYPHVGVLNAKSFLTRYPSTATNRNRARARWTYYNFLGVDIEANAPRSTDPVALADTNNPTMNNAACTVCHSLLDPVAGTFQDYADNGIYKIALNGTDSLDRLYKTTPGSGYVFGDTWYSDMRDPGFEGSMATSSNTTRWLAEQIVSDERFATAAVRFWWPAVMAAELLKAPAETTDGDYQARLAAWSAQQAEIETLADNFVASGQSVKSLLVELALSRWYRANSKDGGSVSAALGEARSEAGLTGEKLLTPELLARKTHTLTGFNWYGQPSTITAIPVSGLENDYNTFYGGIDSFALKTRARAITPMMSNVAATHALEASCPIVLGDFIRPDAQRLLFTGLTPWTTPLTEASATQTILSTSVNDLKSFAMTVSLLPGAKKVVISELNDACDYGANATTCKANKNLVIVSLSITSPNGQVTQATGTAMTYGSCAAPITNTNSLALYSSCAAEYAFTAATSGSYTFTASVSAQQSASDQVLAGMNIEANVAPSTSTASGATAIKNKLVELHTKLLGQTVTITSADVLASYDLLLQTWQRRKAGGYTPSLLQTAMACEWQTDIEFIGTLSYPGSPLLANGRYNSGVITTWLAPQAQDALFMKQSWVVVMTYLLSHYDYLHE